MSFKINRVILDIELKTGDVVRTSVDNCLIRTFLPDYSSRSSLLSSLTLITFSFEDEVVRKDGDRFTGKVTDSRNQFLELQSNETGDIYNQTDMKSISVVQVDSEVVQSVPEPELFSKPSSPRKNNPPADELKHAA